MNRKQLENDGFTIVELLIVIVVIGVLAAIVIVSFSGVSRNAQVAVAKQELQQMGQALELYKLDNGFYPPYTNGAAAPELEKVLRSANAFDVTRWSPSGPQAAPTKSFIFCFPTDASSYAIVAIHPVSTPVVIGAPIIYTSSLVTGTKTVAGPLNPGAIGLAVCRSLNSTYLDRWSYDIPVTST